MVSIQNNCKCSADTYRAGGYFYMRAKHISTISRGFFEGAKAFLTPNKPQALPPPSFATLLFRSNIFFQLVMYDV